MIVKQRECDEAMAKSKGLIGNKYTNLKHCSKDCENCIACIESDCEGNREHVSIRRKNYERL